MLQKCLTNNYTIKKAILRHCTHFLGFSKQNISVRPFSHRILQSNDLRINFNKLNVTGKLQTICNLNLRINKSTSHCVLLRRSFCTKPSNSPSQSPFTIKKVTNKLLSARKKHLENRTELKRLFSLAKDEKWYLLGAIGCLIISSSVAMGVPYAIGKILDMIVMNDFPKEKLHGFCLMLFGVFVVGSLANFGRIYYMNSASKLNMLRYLLCKKKKYHLNF